MGKRLLLRILATLCLPGYAAQPGRNEGWSYSGPDKTLRYPPIVFAGDFSQEQLKRRNQEALEAWKRKLDEVIDAAKEACARESGGERSEAFMAYMKARGWQRFGNPA